MKWSELKYWGLGEWNTVAERLDDLKKKGILWSPGRKCLFRTMDLCPFDDVRVVIMGQDPYPDPAFATGVAFSIPAFYPEDKYPPTLKNILKEYYDDLHYPLVPSGDLSRWCKAGVLMWNAIPSCEAGRSASHHWEEWGLLTKEIVEKLDEKYIVFVLCGRYARAYAPLCKNSTVIETSHPSPLGVRFGFRGSRIFSSTNAALVDLGLDPIDWRLDSHEAIPRTDN